MTSAGPTPITTVTAVLIAACTTVKRATSRVRCAVRTSITADVRPARMVSSTIGQMMNTAMAAAGTMPAAIRHRVGSAAVFRRRPI